MSKIKKKLPAVRMTTVNSDGVFDETGKTKKGNPILEVNWSNVILWLHDEVLVKNPAPKYIGWTYDDYLASFRMDNSPLRFLEPMSAYEPDDYEQNENEIAELKMDGHRGLLYLLEDGNRTFSRNIVKNGWYGENSDQVPHIRDLIVEGFEGTILDGEYDYGGDSMDVQSVMGALPQNAIQYQWKNGFIPYKVFDILYYCGVNVQSMPLWKRKIFAAIVCHHINSNLNFPLVEFAHMNMTPETYDAIYPQWYDYITYKGYPTDILSYLINHVSSVESFPDMFDQLVADGYEGLIIKDLTKRYDQQRSKNFLKLKGLRTYDVVFMGTTEPTKEYEGKKIAEGNLDQWKYWYHPESDDIIILEDTELADVWITSFCDPVSKPFAMGWCGGIQCGVFKVTHPDEITSLFPDVQAAYELGHLYYDKQKEEYRSLIEVAVVKGLDEETQEDIKLNGHKYRESMRTLAIKANGMIDKSIGSLRHPRFEQWRDDKAPLLCKFEDHIGEVKE